MANERNDLVDRLQYLALRLVAMLMHCWPVNANLQIARVLGDILYFLDRKHRQRCLANLQRSFPELSEPQRRRLARQSMREIFMLGMEVLFTTRLIRLNTWSRYLRFENFQPVIQLLLRGQGVILLTAHYGNFEVLNYAMSVLGFPNVGIARPLDNPYISQWLFGLRQMHGGRIIAKKGATDEVVQVMEQKAAVGFVADQNAGAKGVFVDFFGRKASTYKSIGLLAMQYQVPVVIGSARRVNDRFEFVIGVQDIIQPADWSNEDNPLHYITQRYTKAIEDFIRIDPGQYWWMHRRWKSRPRGEAPEAYD